jgi:hypothetical protein
VSPYRGERYSVPILGTGAGTGCVWHAHVDACGVQVRWVYMSMCGCVFCGALLPLFREPVSGVVGEVGRWMGVFNTVRYSIRCKQYCNTVRCTVRPLQVLGVEM